jgi:hypothetical protein
MYIYWNTHAYDTVLLLPQWKTLSYLPEAQKTMSYFYNQNIFMLLVTIKKQLVTSN